MRDTERITHGDLPHWYKPGHAHFVTYRLANSIPSTSLREWREERERQLNRLPPAGLTVAGHREMAHKKLFARYDEYLHCHPGRPWLQEPLIAEIVRGNLHHHHGSLYELIAWCVMPNHVHVVLQPLEGVADIVVADIVVAEAASLGVDAGNIHHQANAGNGSRNTSFHSEEIADNHSRLSRIMHSLKSYTANSANKALQRSGNFWQQESYDHWVRDVEELQRIVDYIRWNPVRAGLCEQPFQWRFSSAFERHHLDGSMCGLVGWLRDDWRQ